MLRGQAMSSHGRRMVALVAAIAIATTSCGGSAAPTSQQVSASPSMLGSSSPAAQATGSLSPAQGSDVSGTIQSGGVARTYLLHLPPASTRLAPTPLVIAFHGWLAPLGSRLAEPVMRRARAL